MVCECAPDHSYAGQRTPSSSIYSCPSMTADWFVVGFTVDEVVSGGQDSRLAHECIGAWRTAGCPTTFRVLESIGHGDHILEWFVNAPAPVVLDAPGVKWRGRIIREASNPPADASDAFLRGPQ